MNLVKYYSKTIIMLISNVKIYTASKYGRKVNFI